MSLIDHADIIDVLIRGGGSHKRFVEARKQAEALEKDGWHVVEVSMESGPEGVEWQIGLSSKAPAGQPWKLPELKQ